MFESSKLIGRDGIGTRISKEEKYHFEHFPGRIAGQIDRHAQLFIAQTGSLLLRECCKEGLMNRGSIHNPAFDIKRRNLIPVFIDRISFSQLVLCILHGKEQLIDIFHTEGGLIYRKNLPIGIHMHILLSLQT